MKEKLLNNWVLKICSVLGAVVIWLLAVNANNPTIDRTISNVRVKILNENAITDNNLAYDIVKGKTVDFVIEGPRDAVTAVTSENCVASVDFSQLAKDPTLEDTALRNILINYSGNFSGNVRISRISTEVMQIRLEEIKKKTLEIKAIYHAEDLPAGYSIDSVQILPEVIQVTGRASVLDNISSAGVELNVTELKDSVQIEAPVYLYNAGGNRITFEEGDIRSVSVEQATVSLSVQKVKELVLDYEIDSEPAEGYRISEITCEPQRIHVKGSQAVLSKLSTITIPSSELDVTGLKESADISVDITDYLPDGTELADPTRSVIKVHVEIEQIRNRTMMIDTEDINLIGASKYLAYEPLTSQISIVVSGLQADLNQLDLSQIVLNADVSGLSEGNHEVSVMVDLPEGLQLSREAVLRLYIYDPEKPTTEVPATETDTTAPEHSEPHQPTTDDAESSSAD